MRDLRFLRGVHPDRSGVRISTWYVPDELVEMPPEIKTAIEDVRSAG